MHFPDSIVETGITLKDRFFDLRGLSEYSSLSVSSLRYHIRENGLPHYCIKNSQGQTTKVLVRLKEFNSWMKKRWREDESINAIVDSVMRELQDEQDATA